jgi:hypothetical protein
MKTKFSYAKEKNKKGDMITYRCWNEDFKDEDTGEVITIQRREAVKINGKRIPIPKPVFKNPHPVKCFAAERKQDGLVLLDSFSIQKKHVTKYIKDLKKEYKGEGTFRAIPVKVTVKVVGR